MFARAQRAFDPHRPRARELLAALLRPRVLPLRLAHLRPFQRVLSQFFPPELARVDRPPGRIQAPELALAEVEFVTGHEARLQVEVDVRVVGVVVETSGGPGVGKVLLQKLARQPESLIGAHLSLEGESAPVVRARLPATPAPRRQLVLFPLPVILDDVLAQLVVVLRFPDVGRVVVQVDRSFVTARRTQARDVARVLGGRSAPPDREPEVDAAAHPPRSSPKVASNVRAAATISLIASSIC